MIKDDQGVRDDSRKRETHIVGDLNWARDADGESVA